MFDELCRRHSLTHSPLPLHPLPLVTPAHPTASPAHIAAPVPPTLALTRLLIPGMRGLSPAEQVQAAALALRRELSVHGDDLRLALATDATSDEVRIAWCTASVDAVNPATPLATPLLAAMQPGMVYWVGAPQGYLIGERGALAIETDVAAADAAPRGADQLPREAATVLASASQTSAHGAARCILVDRDRTGLPDRVLEHWQAASGVEMRDGALPASQALPLVAPPRVTMRAPVTSLDRALRGLFAASCACLALAAAKFALLAGTAAPSPTTPLASGANGPASAGALLNRIGSIAPEALPQLQSATYASGAWLLVLSETDGADKSAQADRAAWLQRTVALLEANGLAVQSTPPPAPRLRVSLP